MFKRTILVFEDWVYGSTSFNTAEVMAAELGRYDLLSLHAVIDRIDAGGTFIAHVWHSADGLNWHAKSVTKEIDAAITAGITNVLVGADASGTPSLGLVRVDMSLTAGTTQGHVKLYATLRDRSKRARKAAPASPAIDAATVSVAGTPHRSLEALGVALRPRQATNPISGIARACTCSQRPNEDQLRERIRSLLAEADAVISVTSPQDLLHKAPWVLSRRVSVLSGAEAALDGMKGLNIPWAFDRLLRMLNRLAGGTQE